MLKKKRTMKKILVLLIFLQFSNLFGQDIDFKNQKICNQISLALKYISQDKTERIKKVNLQDSINNGRNYSNLANEYVAFKLNTEPEKIFSFSSEMLKLHFEKIEKATYKSFRLDYDCINNFAGKPNAFLSKLDDETLVVNIVKNNIDANEGASGITYLFCFNGEKLVRVFKKHWIS
jgi:hypothetical protein